MEARKVGRLKTEVACAIRVRGCGFRCTFSDGVMRCDERVCKTVRPISYGPTAMSRSLIQVSRRKGCVAISRTAGCGAGNAADANPQGPYGRDIRAGKKTWRQAAGRRRG